MDQKKLPHKKSAKNNNYSYQNKNHQLISKIQHYSQHFLSPLNRGASEKQNRTLNNTKQQNYTQNNETLYTEINTKT